MSQSNAAASGSAKQNAPADPAVAEFLAELEEILARLAAGLQGLEQGVPTAELPALVNSIYRDAHSLKGGAYLYRFQELGELMHAMESRLDDLRARATRPEPALLNALYACLNAIEAIGGAIGRGEKADFRPLVSGLVAQLSGAPSVAAAPAAIERVSPSVPRQFPQLVGDPRPAVTPAPSARVIAAAAPALPPAEADHGSDDFERKESNASVRVNVGLLDKMMTLMGEMVLVRNQVLQYSSRSEDLGFLNLSQRLDLVTSELQGEMMKTRMQPVGAVVSKFQRVVRDLAQTLGKRIDFQTSGMETELDRTLLEAIKDPLTHIVRNSCDHGMETPAERKAAGKPETGTVSVRAFHEGGQVIIEIADDGRGLHREKILAKALEKGLVTADRAAGLSEREVQALIFAPGFSTAAQVTNLSGRGVGMDVVRSNVEKVGGIVDLASQAGRGTVIRLKIPLTLAIVPAMIVRCDSDRYAIPQVRLVELVRAEGGDVARKIEYLQGKPVYRLRGKLLPLVDLKGVLKFDGYEDSAERDVVNIVVLNAENRYFGLIVDEILDTADIVVKPLSRFLKSLAVYSGATVLGDGSVAFILDVMGIAGRENLLAEGAQATRDSEERANRVRTELREYLLFKLPAGGKFAVPMERVQRLEEFRAGAVEVSGQQSVIRYRDSILPIVDLSGLLGFDSPARDRTAADADAVMPVLVVQGSGANAGRAYGLEVSAILDVLATETSPDLSWSDRPGLSGNLVANGEVVALVDLSWVLGKVAERLRPGGGLASPAAGSPAAGGPKRVLFAEDTPFLRKQIAQILRDAGYEVVIAEDGQAALGLLEAAESGSFQLVLSDIEMPKMNGFDLVEAIRRLERWRDLPVVALTSLYDATNLEKGRRAGFDDYLKKVNANELLGTLGRLAERKRA